MKLRYACKQLLFTSSLENLALLFVPYIFANYDSILFSSQPPNGNVILTKLNPKKYNRIFCIATFMCITWYLMKSGLVDECLSIVPLVASIQPVFEHINGCGVDNFLCRVACYKMWRRVGWSSHYYTSPYSNFVLVTSQTVRIVATFKKTHVYQCSLLQSLF